MATILKDRFIGFFSVTPNKKFMRLFERAEIENVLISYYYIRGQEPYVENDILPAIRKRGGLFMTDCGAFSFYNDKLFDWEKFDWEAYLKEYTGWLAKNKEYIFSACNLDIDVVVGHAQVVDWNEKYFKPLEKDINIIYVAHQEVSGYSELDLVKEYAKKHKYIGVSEEYVKKVSQIVQLAKQNNCAVHGLAWTKPTVLRDFPFFSVDSSSWVNYQKYGATPVWDGRNFSQYDSKNKGIRQTLKSQCARYKVSFDEFCSEKNPDGSHNDDEGLTFSLCTWREVLQDMKSKAAVKLSTTIREMLDKKVTVFHEGGTAAKTLKEKLDMQGLQGAEKGQLTYQENTDGSQVAVYKKRDPVEVVNSAQAITKYGDTLFCNNCYMKDKCPEFKDAHSCGFDFSPANVGKDPLQIIDRIIELQQQRVERAMLFEKLEGGLPNKVYSAELAMLGNLNNLKAELILKATSRGITLTEIKQTVIQSSGVIPEGESAPTFMTMLKDLMTGDDKK